VKFDIVHSARMGSPFAERPGLPDARASQRIAALIGIASLIALFALAFVNLALTAPALAEKMSAAHLAKAPHAYSEVTHMPSGGKS